MDLKDIKTKRGGVISIHKNSKTGAYITNLVNDSWTEYSDASSIAQLKLIIDTNKVSPTDAKILALKFKEDHEGLKSSEPTSSTIEATTISNDEHYDECSAMENKEEPKPSNEELKLDSCKKIVKFFSEFTFKPAARFINTLCHIAHNSQKLATQYVSNYMKLVDSPDTNNVIEKMKSIEWKEILDVLEKVEPANKINNKLEIYFGPQGTGKTTKATTEYPEAKVVVCNSSMLPDDLMQDFDFNDENGNPQFKKSALRLAMEGGMPIILDEMNLLPLETLRFMQGLTDNKPSINYKGQNVELKEGFKVIGTMNLVVNGQVFGLTEPIVDRCSKIEEFDLTDKQLANISF